MDFGLELLREKLNLQMDTADKIDIKAGTILAAATIGLTFATSIHSKEFLFINTIVRMVLLAISLISFVCVFCFSISAYFVREYHVSSGIAGIKNAVLEENWVPIRLKKQIFQSILNAVNKNAEELDKKTKILTWAMISLVFQLTTIAAIFCFENIH